MDEQPKPGRQRLSGASDPGAGRGDQSPAAKNRTAGINHSGGARAMRGRFRYWLSIRWRGELRFAIWYALRFPFRGGLAYLCGIDNGPTPFTYPDRGRRRTRTTTRRTP